MSLLIKRKCCCGFGACPEWQACVPETAEFTFEFRYEETERADDLVMTRYITVTTGTMSLERQVWSGPPWDGEVMMRMTGGTYEIVSTKEVYQLGGGGSPFGTDCGSIATCVDCDDETLMLVVYTSEHEEGTFDATDAVVRCNDACCDVPCPPSAVTGTKGSIVFLPSSVNQTSIVTRAWGGTPLVVEDGEGVGGCDFFEEPDPSPISGYPTILLGNAAVSEPGCVGAPFTCQYPFVGETVDDRGTRCFMKLCSDPSLETETNPFGLSCVWDCSEPEPSCDGAPPGVECRIVQKAATFTTAISFTAALIP